MQKTKDVKEKLQQRYGVCVCLYMFDAVNYCHITCRLCVNAV